MGPVTIVILILIAAVLAVGYWLYRKEKTGKKNVTEDAVTFRDRFNRVRHMNDDKG
jgi:FtsZ-interacting cell division protein ZipA